MGVRVDDRIGAKKPVFDQSEGYGHNATNTFECYEISGNVWEWCLDWWGALPAYVSGKDYVYRTGGNKRTIRDGGWHSSYWDSEVTTRGYDFPGNHSYYVGFRVVRDYP
ncbi:SUMF1/EgtB/PvdO family nonheme iron enzyme [bacterium]|nr:SUMF1/EgtB/PvdO family nonheme iron enzyme [bacterium]